jgi:hypothetical protein
MRFLDGRLTVPEKLGLRVMIGKSFGFIAHFVFALLNRLGIRDKAARRCLERAAAAEGIRLVG